MRLPSNITPRIRPVPANKSAILSALDVGTSKVVCLIARLDPLESSAVLSGRTHRMRVLGIGHQKSRGLKGGTVIDLAEAEKAIRLAVDAAERMAGVQVASAIVNMSGGRIGSQHFAGRVAINRRDVSDSDVQRVIEIASSHAQQNGRSILHALPVGYTLDGAPGIQEPKGMVGDQLEVDLHIAACDPLAAHNLMIAVERGHIKVEALVATPYASSLATLCDDETQLGATVIDIGGGTTTIAVYRQGHLVHVDAIAVGGNYITLDVARGLSMRLEDAEKLKCRHAHCIETEADLRDILTIRQVSDEEDCRFRARKAREGGFPSGGRPACAAHRGQFAARRAHGIVAPHLRHANARGAACGHPGPAGSGQEPGLCQCRGPAGLPAGRGTRIF
jgi:cell division protein FtsA